MYAWGEPVYILLLICCILLNYFIALSMARLKNRKRLLIIAVVINIAQLALFKYTDFIIGSLNTFFGASIPLPGIAMPIGISFFTFQALSYVIDVYRNDCKPQRSLASFALYISFFPQLIAGPIVKYHEIESYLKDRTIKLTGAVDGMSRFTVGLAKKTLIANVLAGVVDDLYNLGGDALNAPLAWLAAFGYALQIYFDFSGYSDMAIGMSTMFGFRIPDNFRHPYASASIREFWRRWHISLSSWFRDYLYIPLGGNRRGKWRTLLNRLIVFFLTGLWHGASWNFVLWGLGHGALAALESLGLMPADRLKGRWRWAGVVYTFISVSCLFVLFRADSLPEASSMLGAMFSGGLIMSKAQRIILADALTPYAAIILIIAVIASFAAPTKLITRLGQHGRQAEIIHMALTLAVLVLCMVSLIAQTNNPFIYFRF